MQRSFSFDTQWEQTVNDINQLVHIHVNEQNEVDRHKGICVTLFLANEYTETGDKVSFYTRLHVYTLMSSV